MKNKASDESGKVKEAGDARRCMGWRVRNKKGEERGKKGEMYRRAGRGQGGEGGEIAREREGGRG